MGNSSLETPPELLNLNLQTVIDESDSQTVRSVETLGKDQYTKYRKTVILDGTISFYKPIKEMLFLFSDVQHQNQKPSRQTDICSKGQCCTLFKNI